MATQLEQVSKPKFLNTDELTEEQLTDPDFRLKEVQKLGKKNGYPLTCSRCHHCR